MSQNTGHTGDEYSTFRVTPTLYRSRQGIFCRVSAAARRVFPRFEIFVCLRLIFHIVDVVPPTIQQFRIPRIFNAFDRYSRYSDFIGNPLFINHFFESISSRTRNEWKKEKKVRKMQDRDESRKRRLIWREECRDSADFQTKFHAPVDLTRCFPFFSFWMDQVEKYRNRGRTSQPWIRETFGGLTFCGPL